MKNHAFIFLCLSISSKGEQIKGSKCSHTLYAKETAKNRNTDSVHLSAKTKVKLLFFCFWTSVLDSEIYLNPKLNYFCFLSCIYVINFGTMKAGGGGHQCVQNCFLLFLIYILLVLRSKSKIITFCILLLDFYFMFIDFYFMLPKQQFR